MYYSFQKDDITTLDWNGTTYLQEDEWGSIIADNNIFNVDIKVTNKEGNPGSIVVMIVGEKGNKIEGKNCFEVFGNNIDRKVIFEDGSDFSEYEGKTIRLRFRMRDAKLYSMKFEQTSNA